jgi:hypothetical protein
MKKILIVVFAGAFLCGIALAQDTVPPASGSPPPEQQTPKTTPDAQQQAPEPSTSQPQSQQQLPEPQQSPQTQEPPASQPQAAPQSQKVPAQNPGQTGAPTQAGGTAKIAPGSVIPVQLTKSIDAKKVKTGDEVVAKVTQDLKTNGGELIVPKDTKVVGHVTEAQARSKEQKESQVAIAFDHAVMKNGGEMQLPMSIQAIIAPPNNSPGAGGGNDQPAPAPAGNTGGTSAGGARTGGMGSTTPAPTPSASAGTSTPGNTQAGANARPPITASTQGVIGISDLKLSAAQNGTQGSVVSSEKNNVKLDSGTFMLLRVNQ